MDAPGPQTLARLPLAEAVSHNANLRTEEVGRLLNVISEYIACRE